LDNEIELSPVIAAEIERLRADLEEANVTIERQLLIIGHYQADIERLRRALWVYHDRLKNYPELRNLVGEEVMELSQDSYDKVEAEAEASLET
jgi:hypothetical protein